METPTREAVDAATAGIGARLAAIRRDRGLRVSEVARGTGVSSSLISQIERGSTKPSVGTLFALAQVVGVPVDLFFSDAGTVQDPGPPTESPSASGSDDPSGVRDQLMAVFDGPRIPWDETRRTAQAVVRAAERASLDIRGGVRWERLTPTAVDGVEFLELVYNPGAESDRQSYRHPGIELVLVTTGTMTIFLGFDQHDLAAGDSIAFPSSVPHRYVNLTDAETRAVTVILRDDLSRLPIRERADAGAPGDQASPGAS